MSHIPSIRSAWAPDAQRSTRSLSLHPLHLGAPLDARWADAFTRRLNALFLAARPPERATIGAPLPQVVHDASKGGRALLTHTFLRAFAHLARLTTVPLALLDALAFALITEARRLRGVAAPDLVTAMRHEEQANADLNLSQWCRPGAFGEIRDADLHAIVQHAGVQMVASHELMIAADAELARRAALSVPPASRQAARHGMELVA